MKFNTLTKAVAITFASISLAGMAAAANAGIKTTNARFTGTWVKDFSIQIGGWADNGPEQQHEYELISTAMIAANVWEPQTRMVYDSGRNSLAMFYLKPNARFVLSTSVGAINMGQDITLKHKSNYVSITSLIYGLHHGWGRHNDTLTLETQA